MTEGEIEACAGAAAAGLPMYLAIQLAGLDSTGQVDVLEMQEDIEKWRLRFLHSLAPHSRPDDWARQCLVAACGKVLVLHMGDRLGLLAPAGVRTTVQPQRHT